jgi:hypothetical protein
MFLQDSPKLLKRKLSQKKMEDTIPLIKIYLSKKKNQLLLLPKKKRRILTCQVSGEIICKIFSLRKINR